MVLDVSSMTTTLSFNPKLVVGSEIDKLADKKVDVSDPIPLKSTWTLWEQLQQTQPQASVPDQAVTSNYGDLTRKVASIDDVQSFWRYFTHLPQPSAILGESLKVQRQEEDGLAHTLAAIMLFRGDIRPEWEDEANKKGGHFQFTLQYERTRTIKDNNPVSKPDATITSWLARTDEFWNNLVLGLIGETLEPSDFITGVRLVDKVKPPVKPGARPVGHLRVEVWFRDASEKAKITKLEESIEAHLKTRLDGTVAPEIFPGYRLDMRLHEESGPVGDEKFISRPTKKPHARGNKSLSRKGSADEAPVVETQ
jgi:translation initiation factor 4E